MTPSEAAFLTQQLIDAAIAYEQSSGQSAKLARKALSEARASIESALTKETTA